MMKIFSHAGFRTLGAALAVSGGLVLAAVPTVGVQAADAAQATQAGDVAPAAQPIWIDVRTPKEFDGGHLEGAHNVPVEQIAAPTLLLWGDADPISPVAVGRHLEQRISGARLHVVAGGDHDLAQTHATEIAPLIAHHLA